MATDHTRIGVLESRWWRDSNSSLRGFFDALADLTCGNPHAYHYEMIGSEEAAKEAVPRLIRDRRLRLLCIAIHGDDNGLVLHNGSRLSRTELRNRLQKDDGVVLDGLHLAACSVCTIDLAHYILESDTCVKWVSGYSEKVDWIDAAALELLFLKDWILQRDETPTIETIREVATRIRERAGGLVEELGFGVFVRQRGTGATVNLLTTPF